MARRHHPSVYRLVLSLCTFFVAASASAGSRQFNSFTAASDQPPPRNPAVHALETCPGCAPPTRAKPLLEHGCADCAPAPACATCPGALRSESRRSTAFHRDCRDCGESEKLTRAPFTTVTDTCADCEPFVLHPHVGWNIETDRTGTGVHLHDGSLFHRVKDIDIPGRGFSFQLVRRHVSAVSYDGPLGKNWEFNYNMRVDEDGGTGDVTLWDGTGREDVFLEDSGSYTSPAGRFESLTKSGTPAKFILEKPNGTEYELDAASGRLESITDRAGNSMTFSYDGDGRLETVTDTLGRDVDFTYDADDRITKITDFDSREWSYGYTSGELTSVTTPAVTGFASGKTMEYTYAGGKLDTLTDPKDQLILDATHSGGKVTTLRYGDSGDDLTFSYDDPVAGKVTITDRVGNEKVATIDADNQLTAFLEKTNRNVRAGEGDYTTTYAYDANFLLTDITFPEGNTVEYEYASGTDNLTKEEFSDGVDEITSEWTYSSSYNLVKTYEEPRGAVSSGFTTTFYYDFEESPGTDYNGDTVTNGDDGTLVKIAHPTVTTQTPNISPAETFRYNAHGQLTRWDDSAGVVTTFEYHDTGAQAGYLEKMVVDDTVGGLELATEWGHDAVGNITSLKSPRGHETSYTVNELNQVTLETIPISATVDYNIKYEYDANDNLEKREIENLDEDGVAYSNAWITTSWTHETLNRVATVVQEVDAAKNVTTTYTHDDNRNRTQVQLPEGNKIQMEHDERDLLHQRTRGHGSTTDTPAVVLFEYTGNRLLAKKSFEHPEDTPTTYNTYESTYDGFDRLEEIEDPLGHVTEYARDVAGNITEERWKEYDGSQQSYTTLSETDFEYGETGWLSKRSDVYRKVSTDLGVDHDTSYTYRADGQVATVTDPRGNVLTYRYDDAGRRDEREDAFGNKRSATLDANGNITSIDFLDKAGSGCGSDVTRTVDYTYDHRDLRLTEVGDPGVGGLDVTTTWGRDSRGNVVAHADPNGNTKDFSFDGRNFLVSLAEDLEAGSPSTTRTVTSYTYDDNGNLTEVEDDNENATTYEHDDLDRRTKRTNADGTTFTWEFDTEDAITKRTDENGSVVDDGAGLDALGRVTHRDVSLASGVGGSDDEDYEYDGLGRLTVAENDHAKVTFKYDSLGRVYEESTEWKTSPAATRTVKREFDETGNVTKVTYPDGSVIDYVADADLDRIDQVKDGSSIVADYCYLGPFVAELELENGVVRTTSRDAVGRVTSVDHDDGGTTVAKFEYGYDDNGNVLWEKRAHDNAVYDVFEYDKRDQLVTAWYDGTTSSSPAVHVKKEEFDWDGAFNLEERTVTKYGESPVAVTYVANDRNEYTSIGGDSPTWTDNGELEDDDVEWQYVHDYRGNLVEMSDGTSTYDFEFDALGRRVTADLAAARRYTWSGTRILEETSVAATPSVRATWAWGADREPVRMSRASADTFYHGNRDGSVGVLTDANATSVETIEYSAFGEPSISSSTRRNHFLWRGAWFDFDAGLFSDGRAYDPSAMIRYIAATGGSQHQAGRGNPWQVVSGLLADRVVTGDHLTLGGQPGGGAAELYLPGEDVVRLVSRLGGDGKLEEIGIFTLAHDCTGTRAGGASGDDVVKCKINKASKSAVCSNGDKLKQKGDTDVWESGESGKEKSYIHCKAGSVASVEGGAFVLL